MIIDTIKKMKGINGHTYIKRKEERDREREKKKRERGMPV